jgi:hypothetical protein
VCNDPFSFAKGTPFERKGRKATGLRGLSYDSGVADTTDPMRLAIRAAGDPLSIDAGRYSGRSSKLPLRRRNFARAGSRHFGGDDADGRTPCQ